MYGYVLEAEYESGFVLTENAADVSPYDRGGNFFSAITKASATDAGHGQMVRFSLIPVGDGTRYDIDWTELSHLDNLRPIYFRRMEQTLRSDGVDLGGPVCKAHGFGYQYNDADGNNVQVIEEIT